MCPRPAIPIIPISASILAVASLLYSALPAGLDSGNPCGFTGVLYDGFLGGGGVGGGAGGGVGWSGDRGGVGGGGGAGGGTGVLYAGAGVAFLTGVPQVLHAGIPGFSVSPQL